MKNLIIMFLFVLAITGCAKPKDEKVAINIGNLDITVREFDSAYKAYGSSLGGSAGRAKFLDTYVSRKLILMEAERLGMDKDPQFLDSVQHFWEQALLKQMLAEKSQEIASTLNVGDKEISDYYGSHKDSNFPDKTLQEVYPQIKWILLQQKQAEELKDWVNSLEKKVNIKIDYNRLGILPPGK